MVSPLSLRIGGELPVDLSRLGLVGGNNLNAAILVEDSQLKL